MTHNGVCTLLFASLFLLTISDSILRSDDSVLARVSTKKSGVLVGEFVTEDAKQVTVFDFHANQNVTVGKTDVIRIEKPITLDDAAKYAGLAAVMGRQVSLLSRKEKPVGKVAKVTPQVIYLTLGRMSGLSVGQKLTVYRKEGDVVDPDTGEILATERPKIAEVEVTEVNEKVSKGKVLGSLEVKLEIGDEVEPLGNKIVVAVCPPRNNDGSGNATGSSIAEELTGALVQRGIEVVERSALDMVLSELLTQNTVLFDEASAQKLGKLTGATVVLTGKIVVDKNTAKAHLRLIDVVSGKILLAISAPAKVITGGVQSSTGEPAVTPGRNSNAGKEFIVTTAVATKKGLIVQPETVVRTRQGNYIAKNFRFEVTVTVPEVTEREPIQQAIYIGIGEGTYDRLHEVERCVRLRINRPDHFQGKGTINLGKTGGDGRLDRNTIQEFGSILKHGSHKISIVKSGASVTFGVDVDNDGETPEDMLFTIPDIGDYAPYMHAKNGFIFFGGDALFSNYQVTELGESGK